MGGRKKKGFRNIIPAGRARNPEVKEEALRWQNGKGDGKCLPEPQGRTRSIVKISNEVLTSNHLQISFSLFFHYSRLGSVIVRYFFT